MPIAEGEISWNGFLKQVGFNPPSVYEVSGVSVIPPLVQEIEPGSPVQLRCLDGDWFLKTDENPNHSVVLSTNAVPVDRTDIRIIGKGNFVLEPEVQALAEEFEKTIGWDGFAEIEFLDSITFSDIPVTITILCHSPSSLMSVGGEWIATDTTALIIGYSVLNAYWIAPIGIGIGLGIYLVKRRF